MLTKSHLGASKSLLQLLLLGSTQFRGLNLQRNLKIYLPTILFLIAIGLPSRTFGEFLPHWYITYAGDFLWAMMFFFLYCLIFKLKTIHAFWLTIATTYLIEVTQIFHPEWLVWLRSFKLIGLVIGYGFIWSDIIAYTLGISLGAIIDKLILLRWNGRPNKMV